MLEGKINAVSPQLFTANGTSTGQIQVADTAGFRVKQVAYLINNTFAAPGTGQPVPVQIKRVLSPTLLVVGKVDNKIPSWQPLDISSFLVANNAAIGAEQQNNNNIPGDDHYRAVYEADPVVADRVIEVDQYGDFYNVDNPVPVSNVGSAADKAWDDLLLTRDSVTQDITVATYKKGGSTVRTLTFTYDAFENLIEVKKT